MKHFTQSYPINPALILFSFIVLATCTLLSSPSSADNLLTDTFLQPHRLEAEPTSISLSTKLGIDEGSGDVNTDGYRLETPRLLMQKNSHNELLFRASIPYHYVNDSNTDTNRFNIGDPSFLTTLQLGRLNSLTVGVTEPAANRPIEPDVVRFYAFYTHGFNVGLGELVLQAGPEIPDRYFEEGQDDVLSFGINYTMNQLPIDVTLIRKQVVSSKWWNITKRKDSPLNRTNLTLRTTLPISNDYVSKIQAYAGFQKIANYQYIFGLQLTR